MRPRIRVACCLAAALVLALVVPASATDATEAADFGTEPAGGAPQFPFAAPDFTVATDAHPAQTHEVVATGLDNARGLHAVGDAVYVAESGRGGPDLVTVIAHDTTFFVCTGDTGGITRIDENGQTRLATALPSVSSPRNTPDGPACPGTGSSATGPAAIVSLGATLLVATSSNGDGVWRDQIHPVLGTVQHLLPNGKMLYKADIAGYETTHNPDGAQLDSNLYGIDHHDGRIWVADAAGNSVLEVNGQNVSTTAVLPSFDPVPVPALSCAPGGHPALPPPGTLIAPESVPTGVAYGPDGYLYVTTLAGTPYAAGSAKLFRIHPDTGETEVVAEGLNHLTGLDIGPDGAVYVAEMIGASLFEGLLCGNFVPGRIMKLTDDGMEVLGEAPLIGGLAVSSDGSVYVSVMSPFPGAGQVWKFSAN